MINWNEKQSVSVKTLFGLEEMLAKELEEIGVEEIRPANRIVHCKANLKEVYRINLESRLALRVLVNLVSFRVKNPDELYDRVKEIPWEDLIPVDKTFSIDFTVHSSFFTHGKYASLKMKDALVDRIRDKKGVRPYVDVEAPDYRLNLHISEHFVNIAIDASGDSLHKREYRTATVAAPINEVLAAGIVKISGWKGDVDLIDPMCGSGTLLIEAVLAARNIPSGWFRENYGFMTWDNYDAAMWEEIREEARSKFQSFTGTVYAYDRSSKAISIAKYNMQNANLEKWINTEGLTFEKLKPRSNKGVVLMNPPYGERMEKRDIVDFYKMIGNQLKRNFSGWDAWIISSNEDAMKFVGLKPEKKFKLFNGPLEVQLAHYVLFDGGRKEEVIRKRRKRIGE
jgi:putative N6-adenine-specific DNA methylase